MAHEQPHEQPQEQPSEPLEVDCAACVMRNTSTCDDCVVTFVVNREPGEALVIDAAEQRALRALGRAGLTPVLRLRERAG